jgi:hypothetical protein
MANRAITFADGNTLTAANMTQLQKQAVINCDAAVDYPGTPAEGNLVYNVALHQLLQYTTVTTGWRPPWNMPWGYIAQGTATANQTGITTEADLTGLTSGSVNLVANRRYKVSVNAYIYQTVTDTYGGIRIYNDATQLQEVWVSRPTTASEQVPISGFVTFTTTTAAHTIKATLRRSGGTGTMNSYAAATYPAVLLLEDIGPSGAPA